MIVVEKWEREKLEEELRYQLNVFDDLGEAYPGEHIIIIKRGRGPVQVSFLLVKDENRLFYESIEKVVFVEARAAAGGEAELWRIPV